MAACEADDWDMHWSTVPMPARCPTAHTAASSSLPPSPRTPHCASACTAPCCRNASACIALPPASDARAPTQAWTSSAPLLPNSLACLSVSSSSGAPPRSMSSPPSRGSSCTMASNAAQQALRTSRSWLRCARSCTTSRRSSASSALPRSCFMRSCTDQTTAASTLSGSCAPSPPAPLLSSEARPCRPSRLWTIPTEHCTRSL
mmetsp:Transcript_48696/g.155634  ORF Transcript_48696/g.155634 Transcript_48696/m.155634 type:complete len:203 (-) Transcript_48696:457-1065(-)